ncbi:hypothetical protein BV898_17611 [Hypsibius exemplaris]|uniref:SGNH domain-containing protein n=1 Tax=Hypsibius exemplaris TaxID=2072580 RepID=A0A9X6NFU7_HYPEX|nr:hypothetical protein BV898_17611 [Hypsibius exemplaris]
MWSRARIYSLKVDDVRRFSLFETCGHFSSHNQTDTKWTTDEGKLKLHSRNESALCMRRLRAQRPFTNIVLVGDSRTRQLRDGLIYQLTGTDRDWLANRSIQPSRNHRHERQVQLLSLFPEATAVRLEYIYTFNTHQAVYNVKKYLKTDKSAGTPDLLLIGGSDWPVESFRPFKKMAQDSKILTELLAILSDLAEQTLVVWTPQTPLSQAQVARSKITNEELTAHNAVVRSALASRPSRIHYWESYLSTFRLSESLDGLHLGPVAKYFDVQILLNVLCGAQNK